jgi:hypothetical protein
MVGQWGFLGCITLLMPAAKKGTRLWGRAAGGNRVPADEHGCYRGRAAHGLGRDLRAHPRHLSTLGPNSSPLGPPWPPPHLVFPVSLIFFMISGLPEAARYASGGMEPYTTDTFTPA